MRVALCFFVIIERKKTTEPVTSLPVSTPAFFAPSPAFDAAAETSAPLDIARRPALNPLVADTNRTATYAPKAGELGRAAQLYQQNGIRAGIQLGKNVSAPILPTPPDVGPLPERPGWLRRLFESMFGWIRGVGTDEKKLQEYGRQIAEKHGSDLLALRVGLLEQTGVRFDELNDKAIQLITDELATRMQDQAKALGKELPRDVAVKRAAIVADAIYTHRKVVMQRDADNRLALPVTEERDNKAGAYLAASYFEAERTAKKAGPEWVDRLDRMMTASFPPTAPGAKPLDDEAKLAWREQAVHLVSYFMALDRTGDLNGISASTVDGMIDAFNAGYSGKGATAAGVSALAALPDADRARVTAAIDAVPEDRRPIVAALIAREWIGLGAKSPATREASITRIENAARQAKTLTPEQTKKELQLGRLGLERTDLSINGNIVPVYSHPSIDAKEKQNYLNIVRDAYAALPPEVLKSLITGKGGGAGVFGVHLHTPESMVSYDVAPKKSNLRTADGVFQNGQLRLDVTRMDQELILHESGHYVDDIGNSKATASFFDDPAIASEKRTGPGGDLEGLQQHVEKVRERFGELISDTKEPRAGKYASLLGKTRKKSEEKEFREMDQYFAGRAGAVSWYAARGDGGETRTETQRLAEWWAEVFAAGMSSDPKERDYLRAVDPVASAAIGVYAKEMQSGKTTEEAMRAAVSVISAGKEAELAVTDKNYSRSAAITAGFRAQAAALDGWKPFMNDAGLKAQVKAEGAAALKSGEQLAQKLRTADPAAYKELDQALTALRASLAKL